MFDLLGFVYGDDEYFFFCVWGGDFFYWLINIIVLVFVDLYSDYSEFFTDDFSEGFAADADASGKGEHVEALKGSVVGKNVFYDSVDKHFYG